VIGAELRRTIAPVLEAVSGATPRPTRISRAIGLDKSLASRLVRAVQSSSDLDLMHIVPSPGGLRIFAKLAARYADPTSIDNLLTSTERFERLLDNVPGGRASIDAQISESSHVALLKREHMAKQASFKSMSFLLGHFCDVVATTLVPGAIGQRTARGRHRDPAPSRTAAHAAEHAAGPDEHLGRPRRRGDRERDQLRHDRWPARVREPGGVPVVGLLLSAAAEARRHARGRDDGAGARGGSLPCTRLPS
jgi:hypothetical protein